MHADFVRAADKQQLNVPIIASGGAAQSSEVLSKLKGNLALLQPVVVVAEWEGSQQFHTRLHNAVQNRTAADRSTVAHAYDAVATLLKAYAAATPPKSGVQIQEQIPKQRFEGEPGVWGPLRYTSVARVDASA
jgi:hypothetical protein